jgi:large-conductance mechanosensitive channel
MNIIDQYKNLATEHLDLQYEKICIETFKESKKDFKNLKINLFLTIATILFAVYIFYFSNFYIDKQSWSFVLFSMLVGFHFNFIQQTIDNEYNDRFKYTIIGLLCVVIVSFGLIDFSNLYNEILKILLIMTFFCSALIGFAISCLCVFKCIHVSSMSLERAKEVLSTKTEEEHEKELANVVIQIRELSKTIMNSKENMLLLINRDKTNEGSYYTTAFDNIYEAFKEKTMEDAKLSESDLLLKLRFDNFDIKNT